MERRSFPEGSVRPRGFGCDPGPSLCPEGARDPPWNNPRGRRKISKIPQKPNKPPMIKWPEGPEILWKQQLQQKKERKKERKNIKSIFVSGPWCSDLLLRCRVSGLYSQRCLPVARGPAHGNVPHACRLIRWTLQCWECTSWKGGGSGDAIISLFIDEIP